MKGRKIRILIGLILLMFGIGLWQRENILKFVVGSAKYEDYENTTGQYSVSIPRQWKIEEVSSGTNFVSRVVFSPVTGGFQAGNIGQISVTIVASPSASQPYSKQEEFELWRQKVPEEIKGTGVLKLANEVVAGREAVRLAEVDMVETNLDQSFWSVATWFREANKNYYVNIMGNGKLTELELGILSDMLSEFRIY